MTGLSDTSSGSGASIPPCSRVWRREDIDLGEEKYFHPYLALQQSRKRGRDETTSPWEAFLRAQAKQQDDTAEGSRKGSVATDENKMRLFTETIVIRNLPAQWFELRPDRAGRGLYAPSVSPLHRLFSQFGPVQHIDAHVMQQPPLSIFPRASSAPPSSIDLLLEDSHDAPLSPPPLISPQEMHQLGPLLHVWVRFKSLDGLRAAVMGLQGALLSSVTEGRYVVEIGVDLDREGRFQTKTKRKPHSTAPLLCPRSPRTCTSPRSARSPRSLPSRSSSSVVMGGSERIRSNMASLGATLDSPSEPVIHPLLQQKLEDIRLEVGAQLRVLRKGLGAQRVVLREEVEQRHTRPSRQGLSPAQTPTASSREAGPLTGKGTGPLTASSRGVGVGQADLDELQAQLDHAVTLSHELLGPEVIALDASDVASRSRTCRAAVKAASKALDSIEARLRRTIAKIVEAEMQRPSLAAFLLDEGLTFFLQALQAKRGFPSLLPPMHGLDKHGVTLFAPINDAFLEDPDLFEPGCWDVHVVEGMYTMADLARLKQVLPISFQPPHLLRIQQDPKLDCYCVWRKREAEPIAKARVLKADVFCSHNVLLHVVDRILFPMG